MHRLLAPLTAALLAGCSTIPAATTPLAAPVFTMAPLPDSVPSDLPRIARPLNYAIHVTPDAPNLTFTGSADIRFELYEPSDRIILHALDIDFGRTALFSADGELIADLKVEPHDEARQTVALVAPQTIAPGTYAIVTDYAGTIGTQAAGLFALDYPDKRTGDERRALFTQFEAPDARRFAPMFDEPSYKATFDLSATVPSDQMAVSNMPIAAKTDNGDGTTEVVFQTSPLMSSYLLFFGLGDFERATMTASTGTEVGIVAPAGSGSQSQYALEGLAQIMPWFEDYFGLAYPLPKLDNVAGPGQSQFFGAMENWGAIFTFEGILLDDPAITSPAVRQQIYETQVHEVAHQWFGNIVTMAWWDDLWLNEGFASWLDTKVTAQFHPEWQGMLNRVAVRERAMGLDAFANTHPVVQDISTVAELAQAFDGITYSKGEAVIAMLEDYAGQDVWKAGLQDYLATHAYGNTANTDLWAAMEQAGATGLTAIAHDFTTQKGVPLVMATGQCVNGTTQLTLMQSEFTSDRRGDPSFAAGSWKVPMQIAVGNQAPVRQVLEGEASLTLPGCGPVVVNSGQLGYFRTSYMDDMAAAQADAFATFAPIDQLGLLRDAAALSDAGYKPLDYAMSLLEAVPGDANPLVTGYAAGAWADAYETLGEEHVEARAKLAAMASARLAPRLAALGYDPLPQEPVVDTNLRATLLGALGVLGDEAVLSEAQKRFAALADDPRSLDGPLKNSWVGIASANASAADWQLLKQLAASSTSTVERQSYYRRLGAAKDPALAQAALDFALSGEAGTAAAAIIGQVANTYPELAFDFTMAHLDDVRALVDPSGWHGFVAGLARGSTDADLLARLEAYRDSLPADEAVPVVRAVDAFKVRMEVSERQEAALLEWLDKR